MNVMLTGSTGFLGQNLTDFFSQRGISVVTPVRNQDSASESSSPILIKDLFDLTKDVIRAKKTDVFVHCAAAVHKAEARIGTYRKVNTDLTLALAERAAVSGVKRFIFFSSIGVNGQQSDLPFHANDLAHPYDAYTKSKYEAELGLKVIAEKSNMEIVIIRPPLIYGANAPGNFSRFVKLAKLPLPKPLGAINNKRSFVSVENVVDFTLLCLTHPAAANQTFLVSDGYDLSTSDFLRKVANNLGKRALIISMPISILRGLARILGKKSLVDKLTVNLQVDIRKNQEVLGWVPPVSLDDALKRALSLY